MNNHPSWRPATKIVDGRLSPDQQVVEAGKAHSDIGAGVTRDVKEVGITRSVIILGMHRSGTSALTGTLAAAGLQLGAVNVQSEDNRKGNQESRFLMALHNDILARNGGSWDRPPDSCQWESVHFAMRDFYIDSFRDSRVWGFKDPRSLLVLGPWLQALPQAQLLGIFRHPFLVADSLNRRNQMPIDTALDLWSSYNRTLLWHYKHQQGFPLVEFTVDAAEFARQTKQLICSLGLVADAPEFFDKQLMSTGIPDFGNGVSAIRALGIYQRLQSARDEQARIADHEPSMPDEQSEIAADERRINRA